MWTICLILGVGCETIYKGDGYTPYSSRIECCTLFESNYMMQEFVVGFCAIVLATFTTGVDSKSFSVRVLSYKPWFF